MATIRTSHEQRRGCGYRKPGGFYLVARGPGTACGRLPIPADRCPTCAHGLKQARGWTWIDGEALLRAKPCRLEAGDELLGTTTCGTCPMRPRNLAEFQRAGLIWVGEAFYPTPAEFIAEANALGISRKVRGVPREFKAGETWVLLAHPKVPMGPCPGCSGSGRVPDPTVGASPQPGLGLASPLEMACPACRGVGLQVAPAVFWAFRPEVEYVVTGQESAAELAALEARGIALVNVVPDELVAVQQTA